MKLFELLIVIIAAVFVYKRIHLFVARLLALRKISSLKRECDAKITYTRPRLASLFKLSSRPDLTVETSAALYAVRFINGGSRRYVHFASDEYFVSYRRSYFTILEIFSFRRYKSKASVSGAATSSHSVKILPKLDIPTDVKDLAESQRKPIVPVLIFSPVPIDLTYVTKEKTSIKVAFSGDDVHGQRVFTPKAFASFADRETRSRPKTRLN